MIGHGQGAHRSPRRSGAVLAAAVLIGGLLGAVPGTAVGATGDVGYRDFSYSGASAPTGQKPESKLWFNDGSWWGVLYSSSLGKWTIYRFDWAANAWSNTGTVVDPRANTSPDALWDGSKLFITNHMKEAASGSDMGDKIRRFSYDSSTKTYSLDSGFPVTLTTGAVETTVIDKDTTGRIWATWTTANASGGRQTTVTHSTTDTATYITPYVIPVSGAATLSSDDISTLVAYNGKIGVMWSNQNDSTVYFAIHQDGAGDDAGSWTINNPLSQLGYADDHLNIKSLQADSSGQVFAAVKTSLNDLGAGASAPLILLLSMDGTGGWHRTTFSTVGDNQTRPIVLLDPQHRQLYMFAAGPCCSGGVIYYK